MASTTRDSYRLISADSHVNEPPDLFVDRVPARYRDRAPRIERFDEGDAWVIEGVDEPINFGYNACAGLEPEQMRGWVRFEEIRAGGYDPAARLDELDCDGVDAEVLYPTPRLFNAIVANHDAGYHHAMVGAYNDWLSEYVAHAPERFAGLAVVPNRGAAGALAEIDRVADRPGIRGLVMGLYPNGTLAPTPEDDRVFGRVEDLGLALAIHVSLSDTMPSAHRVPLPGWGRLFDIPGRMVELVFAGVFDRFPALRMVAAEVDCGWLPYVKEQIDDNYRRLAPGAGYSLARKPSEYIEEHFHFGFMTDRVGIRLRHDIGVERMLWSSDYPHVSSDWPESGRAIEAAFAAVPDDERHAILAGNAQRLYGFGVG